MTLTFVPQALRTGDYAFAIGTAGSTMLVLQTILLPLALADGVSTVELEGGTHNPTAPPFDFMDRAFLPLLRRMGANVELELVRPGFYPAGGGKIRVRIIPSNALGPWSSTSAAPSPPAARAPWWRTSPGPSPSAK